jgi:hypothetical protein
VRCTAPLTLRKPPKVSLISFLIFYTQRRGVRHMFPKRGGGGISAIAESRGKRDRLWPRPKGGSLPFPGS